MKLFVKTLIALSFLCVTTVFAQPRFPANPADAKLDSTDLKNFIVAYDKLTADGDVEAVLKQYYFDKASPGLKGYIRRFEKTSN